jgi:hypothetical protein
MHVSPEESAKGVTVYVANVEYAGLRDNLIETVIKANQKRLAQNADLKKIEMSTKRLELMDGAGDTDDDINKEFYPQTQEGFEEEDTTILDGDDDDLIDLPFEEVNKETGEVVETTPVIEPKQEVKPEVKPKAVSKPEPVKPKAEGAVIIPDKNLVEVQNGIGESYKKLMVLVPKTYTIPYIQNHNTLMLNGISDSKKCGDIDLLMTLFEELQTEIYNFEGSLPVTNPVKKENNTDDPDWTQGLDKPKGREL